MVMIKYADVLIGLHAGDEGKGKVAHALAKDYDMVLRYNGGANAGHTVYHNGQKIVTHQVPIGVLFGIPSIIGLGCVVNLEKLEKEIAELNQCGITTDGLIFVDERAHLVLDKHIEEDSSESKIGTTGQGIGPTYRDKYNRTGMRMKDWSSAASRLDIQPSSSFSVIDTYELLHNTHNDWRILCEGAQGFQIDIDWGDYPYVTSSHCTVGSAVLNGIPPKKLRKIIGVMKAYETYSGFKTTFQDESDPILNKIQEVGGEFGATTGRKRKVRWLDLDGVVKAININGVTELIINKADVLEQVGVFKYVYNGLLEECATLDEFQKAVNMIIMDECGGPLIRWSMTPNGI
jgi:adenylosuccinate synthase